MIIPVLSWFRRRPKPSATLHDIRTARAQAIAKAKVLTTAQLRLEGQL